MMNGNATNNIPSRDECMDLMEEYGMLPNIVEHSRQVMHVSLAIVEQLQNRAGIDRERVLAGALLHDITKTRSLKTKERHDASGGVLLRERGYVRIAEIVEQHVVLRDFNPHGDLEEREIVFYADKRVMHDKVVTLDERIADLIQRYGKTEEIRRRILENLSSVYAVEDKIARALNTDIDLAMKRYFAGMGQADE
jgi:putative nucleotidyltransferase with HDIG domain